MSSHAHAYLSRTGVGLVLAAVAVNDVGIRYEPDFAMLLPLPANPASVGQAVLETLSRYCRRDRNLRGIKKTECPAFLASGLSSVRAFEHDFSFVALEQDDRRLTMTRYEQNHAAADSVHLPAAYSAEDIGLCLLQMVQKVGL